VREMSVKGSRRPFSKEQSEGHKTMYLSTPPSPAVRYEDRINQILSHDKKIPFPKPPCVIIPYSVVCCRYCM
jgi:hypothetical protein